MLQLLLDSTTSVLLIALTILILLFNQLSGCSDSDLIIWHFGAWIHEANAWGFIHDFLDYGLLSLQFFALRSEKVAARKNLLMLLTTTFQKR